VLLINRWFHGDITTAEAEKLLHSQKAGNFLVRLSTTQAGSYTISKVSRKGCINHQRIEYKPDKGFSVSIQTKKVRELCKLELVGRSTHNNNQQGKKTVTDTTSLQHLIESTKSDLYLKVPCPGSPYEYLFAKNKSKLDGYLIFDSDGEDDE